MMEKAGQELPPKSKIPSDDVRVLRVRLTLEETLEFAQASGIDIYIDGSRIEFGKLSFHPNWKPDLIEMVDACADISVVNTGALSAMGVDDQEVLEEVDQNNLLKFVEMGPCGTCDNSENPGHVWSFGYKPGPADWILCPACDGRGTLGGYRDKFGKWIKPLKHPKPNFEKSLAN